jgi:hypothetical protein
MNLFAVTLLRFVVIPGLTDTPVFAGMMLKFSRITRKNYGQLA